jgi:hypothetical protein
MLAFPTVRALTEVLVIDAGVAGAGFGDPLAMDGTTSHVGRGEFEGFTIESLEAGGDALALSVAAVHASEGNAAIFVTITSRRDVGAGLGIAGRCGLGCAGGITERAASSVFTTVRTAWFGALGGVIFTAVSVSTFVTHGVALTGPRGIELTASGRRTVFTRREATCDFHLAVAVIVGAGAVDRIAAVGGTGDTIVTGDGCIKFSVAVIIDAVAEVEVNDGRTGFTGVDEGTFDADAHAVGRTLTKAAPGGFRHIVFIDASIAVVVDAITGVICAYATDAGGNANDRDGELGQL